MNMNSFDSGIFFCLFEQNVTKTEIIFIIFLHEKSPSVLCIYIFMFSLEFHWKWT